VRPFFGFIVPPHHIVHATIMVVVFEAITLYFILHAIGVTTATTSLEDAIADDATLNEPTSYRTRSVRSTKNKESSRSMIFPGTNWCGKGWKVSGYSNLGAYSGADKCCRQHDLGCPYSIAAGETKYGLYNFKFYTISHCTCDERFRSCLNMVNSANANMVGQFFFNLIRIPCFTFAKKTRCTSWTWWGKCLKEETKMTGVIRPPVDYST